MCEWACRSLAQACVGGENREKRGGGVVVTPGSTPTARPRCHHLEHSTSHIHSCKHPEGNRTLRTLTGYSSSDTSCPHGSFSKPAHVTNADFLMRPDTGAIVIAWAFQVRGRCHICTCFDDYCSKLVTSALGSDFISPLDCRRMRSCCDKWREDTECDLEAFVRLTS